LLISIDVKSFINIKRLHADLGDTKSE